MHKKKEIIMPLLVFIILLVLWEGAVYIWGISLYILPSPSSMMMALFENIEILLQHALVTLSEALLGLCIAVVLAMLIGITMDNSKAFKNSIFPHLVVTQTVPVMVLAPLFSIWLGFGMAPKVWMVIFMCFFPIVISFADGMAQVDTHQINLLRSYHAKRWQLYALVKIPAAAPSLFSGLKVAATYCVGGAIVGEWISSGAGLGYYMLRVKNGYMLDKVFACVLVVIVISLLLHGIVRLIERACCPHRVNKNKRREKMKKLWLSSMALLMCMGVTACINKTNQADGKEVTLVLDYVPNTNHTGLYIAQEKGYFEEEGLKVTIIEPGDNNTSATLVATNKGQFGISYQEDVTAALSAKDPLPIKAIATIMQHNTSGFAVLKDSGMTSPKDFEGKVYAGWQSPSEEAVIKAVMHAYDADFSKLTMVGSDGSGFASMGKTVDILWVFEGWDLVKATMSGVETTYMPLKDLDARLDYYTPVVITNQEMLTNDPETIKRFMKAIKKGYEDAITNPKEAASILHTYAPEYELEYLEKSQEFVSSQYAMDSEQWGWMKGSVWDNYTEFMYENGLIDKKITASEQYTNEFLK